jgi:hypothetical protein
VHRPGRALSLLVADARPIRVVSAPRIREASAAAAAEVAASPAARPAARDALPAPHRGAVAAAAPRALADLRARVGQRDRRDAVTVALEWTRGLGRRTVEFDAIAPGDLLVFDHVISDEPSDLVAIASARDDRGVIELVYVGGGVVRRGYVDPARPAMRRDAEARVVNTFLRHGKRWPAKGTHYLAGELLAYAIRAR